LLDTALFLVPPSAGGNSRGLLHCVWGHLGKPPYQWLPLHIGGGEHLGYRTAANQANDDLCQRPPHSRPAYHATRSTRCFGGKRYAVLQLGTAGRLASRTPRPLQ